MTVPSVLIRREEHSDLSAVLEVNRAAFGGDAEAELVARLYAAGDVLFGLVAVAANRVVGHILFSRLGIEAAASDSTAAALAPLAVAPEWQRRGIGTALVTRGLEICRETDLPGVVVLGDPAFYGRFGFLSENAELFHAPWSGPYLMAIELIPGGLGERTGVLRYATAFSQLPE